MSPGPKNFIREIHRRSLWQVLGIYLMGSWGALQIINEVVETAQLPEWLPGMALVLLIIGLPVVLATAVVQEGFGAGAEADDPDARVEETGATASPGGQTGSLLTWRNALFGGVAAFALWGVVATAWLILGGPSLDAGPNEARPALAVIPFLNSSTEGGDQAAFLATGLHDDLLTQLSKIAGMDVIGRTSVMQYADTEKTADQIGAELGVAYILEGSVMRAGGQVRINVQLLETDAGSHLWAETYDRPFSVSEIFAIQADLARRITAEMRTTLAPEEETRIAEVPTQSTDAYELYLRGKEAIDRAGFGEPELHEAEAFLERALELDPDFRLAHAHLSRISSSFFEWGYDRSPERLRRAREAARAALSGANPPPEAHLAVTFDHLNRFEYDDAAQALDQAAAGLPGSVEVVWMETSLHLARGEWMEALAGHERAAALDPRNPETLLGLAVGYADHKRFSEADSLFDLALELNPTFYDAGLVKGLVAERGRNDSEPMQQFLDGLPPGTDPLGIASFFRWLGAIEAGDVDAAAAVLDQIDRPVVAFGDFFWWPMSLSEALTYLGTDPARGLAALNAAVSQTERALDETPEDLRIRMRLAFLYSLQGRHDDTVRELESAMRHPSVTLNRDHAEILREAYGAYARVGEAAAAVDVLERLLSIPIPESAEMLLADGDLDGIRDTPEMRALVERLGLGEAPGG